MLSSLVSTFRNVRSRLRAGSSQQFSSESLCVISSLSKRCLASAGVASSFRFLILRGGLLSSASSRS